MLITIKCNCGTQAKINADSARLLLRAAGPSAYSYGRHVADPRAFAMRYFVIKYHWVHAGGLIGKSTITMTCPACVPKLPRFEPDPEDSFK